MFRRKRVLKAVIDPDHPDAPCLLVWGGVGEMVEGETIDVKMPDRTIIPGFVRSWTPSVASPAVGTWVVQIAPLAEGDDRVCTCLPFEVDGRQVLIESVYCVYHMLMEEDE